MARLEIRLNTALYICHLKYACQITKGTSTIGVITLIALSDYEHGSLQGIVNPNVLSTLCTTCTK